MKDHQLDVVRGSGNVYRDLGQDNADVKQFKALYSPPKSSRPSIANLSPCVGRRPAPASPRRTSLESAARISAVSRSTAWWG